VYSGLLTVINVLQIRPIQEMQTQKLYAIMSSVLYVSQADPFITENFKKKILHSWRFTQICINHNNITFILTLISCFLTLKCSSYRDNVTITYIYSNQNPINYSCTCNASNLWVTWNKTSSIPVLSNNFLLAFHHSTITWNKK
jgi:hypothetical protein